MSISGACSVSKITATGNPTVADLTSESAPLADSCIAASDETCQVFQRRWPIAVPMLALVCVSLIIRWTDFDLKVAGLFYDRSSKSWTYELAQPWLTIYRQGTLPSFFLGIGGAIVALFGPWILPRAAWRRSRAVRRAGLFLALMLVLGPGLIVNVGFKDLWGRPRPIQCTAFNGEKEFLPVGTWAAERSRNSSFPSGHAAVAFYLMAPGFIAGQRRPRRTAAFFLGGTAFGFGMGLTRVVQGGHFVSDVLWAGALVYLTGAGLAWIILRNDGLQTPDLADELRPVADPSPKPVA